jgi:endogenous inhibitor of DNA gyrase (YacG/DUF329 family)
MQYKCPSCEAEITWDTNNEFRPFCSAQCKNKDFIGWANEEHVMAGSSLYDDVLSNDIEVAKMSDYKKDH